MRAKFYKSFTLGSGSNAWQYQVSLYQVLNPNGGGSVSSSTAIPEGIFIELGNLQASFDIGELTGVDKVASIKVKMLDDATGTWIQTNIFTRFGLDSGGNQYVYQLQVQCDKGSGTLQTIFWGEVDTRSIVFQPDYMDTVLGLRRQMVEFTATDVFTATLQSMPFGDNEAYSIDGGTVPAGANYLGAGGVNVYLPPTTAIPQPGAMQALSYPATHADGQGVTLSGDPWTQVHPPNIVQTWVQRPYYLQDVKFASYKDVVICIANLVATRIGWTSASPAIDFSHITFSYSGGGVADIASQLALHRSTFLSSNHYEHTGSNNSNEQARSLDDFSLAKQGTAWDGLKLLLECFLQYAFVTYDDAASKVTLHIATPLAHTPPPFATNGGTPIEPKVSSLKYTPLGFGARSVSAHIIHPDPAVTGSGFDDELYNASGETVDLRGLPTNTLSYIAQLTNSNVDISTELFMGNYYNSFGPGNMLQVFGNGPDYSNVYGVSSNANGGVFDGSFNPIGPISINLGFLGGLGTYNAYSWTIAVARALFSMYCGLGAQPMGQTPDDVAITSAGMEIAEFDILIDPFCPSADGTTTCNTTGIESALLSSIKLTTDSQHSFLITEIDYTFQDIIRTAHVKAVRQLT